MGDQIVVLTSHARQDGPDATIVPLVCKGPMMANDTAARKLMSAVSKEHFQDAGLNNLISNRKRQPGELGEELEKQVPIEDWPFYAEWRLLKML